MTHLGTALPRAARPLAQRTRALALADMTPVLLVQVASLLLIALSASTVFSVAWAAAGAFERMLGQ